MNNTLALPIGHPDSNVADADIPVYLEALSLALSWDGSDFVPSNPNRKYGLDASAAQFASFQKLYALWDGVAIKTADDQLSIQMAPSSYLDLQRKYKSRIPIPKIVTYGPVAADTQIETGNSTSVKAGEFLGTLAAGSDFILQFSTEAGYRLDPLYVIKLLENEDLWDLPSDLIHPLLDATPAQENLLIVGPGAAEDTAPYLKLMGGQKGIIVLNPGDSLSDAYFSCLSNDEVNISVENSTSDWTLRVEDVSDDMYQTNNDPKHVDKPAGRQWTFLAETELKPFHETYNNKENGKRVPGKPLCYKLTASTETDTLETTFCQDIIDIIRQEYRHHSNPIQNDAVVLDIPTRIKIKFNRERSANFSTKEMQKGNYDAKDNNWILNATENFIVAELMRSYYVQIVEPARILDPETYAHVRSNALTINSSWRNPERNEDVGGARKSNHQFGKALDLKSSHRGGIDDNPKNIPVNYDLFQAGRRFLAELIVLNTGAKCTKVEIFLERFGALLWKYSANAAGEISSTVGSKYGDVVGEEPPDEEAAIKKACRFATHIHIAWPSTNPDEGLVLPEPVDLDPFPDDLPLRNIILIATEDAAVPEDDQIPINFAANSLKKYFDDQNNGISTEIFEVSNALEWLEAINAFRIPQFQINYFFSLSHAWERGLNLVNYPDGTDYISTIHDPDLFDQINLVYGYPSDNENYASEDFDEEVEDLVENVFEYGPNDFTQIRTHQIRISNLTKLPDIYRARLIHTFQKAKGIFLLGCNTDNEDVGPNSTFCDAFATLVRKQAYGAFYYSSFFTPDDDDEWEAIDISRQAPDSEVPDGPIVLVPGKYGLIASLGYIWTYRALPPDLASFPDDTDLLTVYRDMLTRCDPQRLFPVEP